MGDAGAAHAENEQRDQHKRAGILEGVRKELRRHPEGRPRIKAPGLVYRVQGETRGQRRRTDHSQIDSHRAPAQHLQQHD